MPGTRSFLNYIITIILIVLAAFQQSNRIGSETIKVWDEASGARNAIEMMVNRNYLVVREEGSPTRWDVKPPLSVWLKVLSYKIFGINEFAVRFPTTISSWLTMILLSLFAFRWLKKPETAWILLILIATTKGYMTYHVARNGDPDCLLVFFVTGYILSCFIMLEQYPEKYEKYLVITGLAVLGAVYTKGIAGLMPLAGIGIYTLFAQKGRVLLTRRNVYLTMLSVMALIMIYYIGREILDPGYLKAVWNKEIGLILYDPTIPFKHPEKVFYINYLYEFALKPWIFLVPVIIPVLVFGRNNPARRLVLYSFTGALIFLIILSVSHTKNEWYIAPIYPFVWIMSAVSFYEFCKLIISRIHLSKIRIVLVIILCLFPGYFAVRTYREIYQDNYTKPGDWIYDPERDGHYLKHVKTDYPELKDLVILTKVAPRQVLFYTWKYKVEDGTNVDIMENVNSDLTNRKVIVTDTINRNLLLGMYDVTLLDSAKYGRLYRINSLKDTSNIK